MPVLATVTYLVRSYDEAIAFFVGKLGFALLSDEALGDGKRWVVVAPQGGRAATGGGARLLLAEAATEAQAEAVGRQAGGRVFLFLETDDFARDHAALQRAGVVFREAPRQESYGTVAVFEDLYGQPWDLIEPKQ
jgi:catechol 2,3-dioxygenase-like lactoylglutathione lyase family enzyme